MLFTAKLTHIFTAFLCLAAYRVQGAAALPALSRDQSISSLAKRRVGLSVFVPALAVSSCEFQSSCDDDSISPWSYSAAKVFATSHWLQMFRVDTAVHTAQVIDVQPLWNRADEKLVKQSMREFRDSVFSVCHVDSKPCVAVSVKLAKPDPAARFRYWHDLLKQSIEQRTGLRAFAHRSIISDLRNWRPLCTNN